MATRNMVISAKIMFLFPVWIFFAGAVLVLTARALKAGRATLWIISFLAALSSVMTLFPFLFFSQPRTVGYFRDLLVFRIETVTCAAALCLSAAAAGLIGWPGASYRETGLHRVFALLLLGMTFATASIFAANPASMILCTALTIAVLIFLRKEIGQEDRKTRDARRKK